MRIGIREQLAVVVLVTALLPLAVRVVEKIGLLCMAVCGFSPRATTVQGLPKQHLFEHLLSSPLCRS
jgi:hypothetical protein